MLGTPPIEVTQLIERRRALGLDLFDELWEGDYHMVPAPHPHHAYLDQQMAVLLDPLARTAGLIVTGPFNLGDKDDFRVPDRGIHQGMPSTTWLPTATMVIEIVSPDDETYEKLPFYARHHVQEVLIVDGSSRTVAVLALRDGAYAPSPTSDVIGLSAEELTAAIDWP